jgi:hypothetical protein
MTSRPALAQERREEVPHGEIGVGKFDDLHAALGPAAYLATQRTRSG